MARGPLRPRRQHGRGVSQGQRRDAGAPVGLDTLYGRNAVRESLRASRRRPKRLLLARGTLTHQPVKELAELAETIDLPVEEAERSQLDELATGANHQGACLVSSPYPYVFLSELLGSETHPLYLVLDSLQDPQNLGSLLRTAEAVGVTGVIIPEHRAVAVTPAVVNASAGAAEYIRVVRVANLRQALEELKKSGVWVLGLDASPDAVSLWQAPLEGPVALVVGSEGTGIRRLVLEGCDIIVSLPLLGRVESLNAAVAGSVALYEVLRRRSVDGET